MLSLLAILSPLIAKLGLFLIDMFYRDEKSRLEKKRQFISAIDAHLDEAHRAVHLSVSDRAQREELLVKVMALKAESERVKTLAEKEKLEAKPKTELKAGEAANERHPV